MVQDVVQDADYINRPEVIILFARFQRQIANGGIGSRKEGATKWKDRRRLFAAATFITVTRSSAILASARIRNVAGLLEGSYILVQDGVF